MGLRRAGLGLDDWPPCLLVHCKAELGCMRYRSPEICTDPAPPPEAMVELGAFILLAKSCILERGKAGADI